jgi:hypothetical protein
MTKFTLLSAAALCALGLGLAAIRGEAEESPHLVPAPLADEAPGAANSETAILAGGCFWGVQGVFQHVKGVTRAVSGYAGGEQRSAHYQVVETGATGHAESVSVTFDPHQISYGRILQIYFSVAHDPTELNLRARTAARNTAPPSSRPMTSRRGWPRPISSSWTRRMPSPSRSSPNWSRGAPSTRPRTTTRTS